jgi:hypothetical protein
MNPNISRQRRAKSAHRYQGKVSGNAHDDNSTQQPEVNVGDVERQISLIGGTVLALCGLTRGTFTGLALAAIGGALIWRGYTGHCDVYEMLDHSTAEQSSEQRGVGQQAGQRQHSRIQYDESHA